MQITQAEWYLHDFPTCLRKGSNCATQWTKSWQLEEKTVMCFSYFQTVIPNDAEEGDDRM